MTTSLLQGKSDCGKQFSFSGTFTQEPAVREPFPGCCLVRGSTMAPAAVAQGKMRGEAFGSDHLLGLGGQEGKSSVLLSSGCLESSSVAC